MNAQKLQKRLSKRFGENVKAEIKDGCIVLSGSLTEWEDIIEACSMSVDKKGNMHVVNDIELRGVENPRNEGSNINDDYLEGGKARCSDYRRGNLGASIEGS